jgi:hypothetical protein
VSSYHHRLGQRGKAPGAGGLSGRTVGGRKRLLLTSILARQKSGHARRMASCGQFVRDGLAGMDRVVCQLKEVVRGV